MAYVRQGSSIDRLLVADKDGSNEHAIFSPNWLKMKMLWFGQPGDTNGGPAWSPDGRTLAVWVLITGSGRQQLMTISPDGGSPTLICGLWAGVDSVGWQPDGRGIILEGRLNPLDTNQIWSIDYPGCVVHRITNDTNSYKGVSVTTDSNSILTVQQTVLTSIWIVDAQGKEAKKISSSSPSMQDGKAGVAWMKDGSILYTFKLSDYWSLGLMDPVAHRATQVTTDAHNYVTPFAAPDGRTFSFQSDREGPPAAIWRMNRDGSAAKRLSASFGYDPVVSTDGKWVFYFGRKDGRYGLLRTPYEGGEAQFISEQPGSAIGDSSNGKLVARVETNDTDSTWRVAMIPVEGGPPAKVSPWTSDTRLFALGLERVLPRLSPDRNHVVFLGANGGVENLWTQEFDGKALRQLSHFSDSEHIFDFAISPDGRVAVSRGTSNSDIVLISNFK